MTESDLRIIASQLGSFITQLRRIKSRGLGSVTGGPFFDPFPPRRHFQDLKEFYQHFRDLFNALGSDERWGHQVVDAFPPHAAVCFTHGDLHPGNIIVQGSVITAIVDWDMGGFYPEYWEVCRMMGASCGPPTNRRAELGENYRFDLPRSVCRIQRLQRPCQCFGGSGPSMTFMYRLSIWRGSCVGPCAF